jgi:hypothetical protein
VWFATLERFDRNEAIIRQGLDSAYDRIELDGKFQSDRVVGNLVRSAIDRAADRGFRLNLDRLL